ncbi:sigma-54-dependent Fis family transcriptional regulator [uncultured Clostridium sp.]|uniref:sigma-54 interaction domain-containing protein n=1 Tax=uncultured Clostridium sp. TaxID=59620 RepID=UPI00258F8336|nr:sigma 54-interacting transcriptional regulator [uncultured Clostridium sp.]MDU1349975.1 sigma 54-interacting transcriptional regulator [Clostridium argentinense]
MKVRRWIEKILNSLNEGVIITDINENILFFNKACSKFLRRNINDNNELTIRNIFPDSVVQSVVESGIPKLGALLKENDRKYFCNIFPIFSEDKIIEGITIIIFLKDDFYLDRKIKELNKENQCLLDKINYMNRAKYTFENIIAVNNTSIDIKNIARKISKLDVPVLIESEDGCRKEVYAQAIHNNSKRSKYPFITVDCSTSESRILEGILFGYEDNILSDRKRNKKMGMFEIANHGTIFLDKISEIDYSLQEKLLRVLQESTIRKIGGIEEIDIDVRIICACDVNLMKYAEEGKFRKDLYYRIAAFPIYITPLRERREDIPRLLNFYIEKLSNKFKRKICLTDDAKALLCNYDWPGNISEMENILEFLAIATKDGTITKDSLPKAILESSKDMEFKICKLSDKIKQFEKEEIIKAIEYFGDTVEGKKKAAKHLGISLSTLYYKLN